MAISLRSVYLYIQEQGGTVRVPNNKRVPNYFADKLMARSQPDAAEIALRGLVELRLVRWDKRVITAIAGESIDPATLSDTTIFGAGSEPPGIVTIGRTGEISYQPADADQSTDRIQPPGPSGDDPPGDNQPGNGSADETTEDPPLSGTPLVPRPSALPRSGVYVTGAARPTGNDRRDPRNGRSYSQKPAFSTTTGAANTGATLDPTRLAFENEDLVAKNRSLAETNRGLRRDIKARETALAERDETEAALHQQIAALRQDLANRDTAAARSATEHDELVSKHHTQDFELRETNRKLKEAEDALAKLEARVGQLTEQLTRNSPRGANERLEGQITKLKEDKDQLNRIITELRTEIRELKRENRELATELKTETEINKAVTQELEDAEDALGRLTKGKTGQHHLACGHLVIVSFDPNHQLDPDHPDCKRLKIIELENTERSIFKPAGFTPQPDAPRHERRGQRQRPKRRR